jgi:hypothetical protein
MTDPVEERAYRWPRRCLLAITLTLAAVITLVIALFVL